MSTERFTCDFCGRVFKRDLKARYLGRPCCGACMADVRKQEYERVDAESAEKYTRMRSE